ncbi:putative glucuronosyltransferase [Helianthus annuus]|nr:putative glucuronosyltransferase [Helianthus annuus]KAJ0793510.1 putative glucuronosyltransferase [Helianthus annuus]
MVDEKELCVIHYTLGPLKPWDWWTSWLLKPVDIWQEVREHLEESLPGTGGGRNPHDHLLVNFLFLLPVFILLFCYYRSFIQFANGAHSMVPDYLGGISVLVCHQRVSCDIAPWYYGLGMAFLAVAAPLTPGIFGITALILRLSLMVAGGLVLASFMTYASEHLAIRSFMRGLEDRDTSRTQNTCVLCC